MYGQTYPPNPSPQFNGDTQSTLAMKDAGYYSPHKNDVESHMNDNVRHATNRTPSPTPSEAKELAKTGVFDWKAMASWRFWFRREWLWYYVALVIIGVLAGLMTLYHEQIVHWLEPAAKWLHDLPGGWAVPIGILFVISFPPLFGHEIVAVLCGLIWGLWIGFGIVSAGTFLGEVGNFYAFKWCLRSRGEKLERENIQYGCLAKVVRDGGFWIALIARFSAIPGHFTTAIFSTCGMGIFVFSLAAILSMPKQFITVYLGVLLEQSDKGVTDKNSQIISKVVLVATALVTVVAMWYIYHRMNKVKVEVIHMRRKRRQGKVERAASIGAAPYGQSPYGNGGNSFNSESTIRFDSTAHFAHAGSGGSDIPLQAPRPHRQYSGEQGYEMYESKSDDTHKSSSSVGHDMFTSKPYEPVDTYGQAQYIPPGRVSTSSRQPIAPNATYFTGSQYPVPDMPAAHRQSMGTPPPNFSRVRTPPPSSPPPSNYPNPLSVLPPPMPQSRSQSSGLAYDDEPLHSPFDDPPPKSQLPPRLSPPPSAQTSASPQILAPQPMMGHGHMRETTDASFTTAYEPSTWEPGHHHRYETSEGPKPPGYFAPN